MSLESTTIIDQIEVLQDCQIQVRQAKIVTDFGKEIARSYTRWVLVPGQTITDQDPKVQTVANAVWTPSVISDYQTAQAAIKSPLGESA